MEDSEAALLEFIHKAASLAACTSLSSYRPGFHPLYDRRYCVWPGCETPCATFEDFKQHVELHHSLNQRSENSVMLQLEVIHNVELRLLRECEKLETMHQHLTRFQRQVAPSSAANNTQPRLDSFESAASSFFESDQSGSESHEPTTTEKTGLEPVSPDLEPVLLGLEPASFDSTTGGRRQHVISHSHVIKTTTNHSGASRFVSAGRCRRCYKCMRKRSSQFGEYANSSLRMRHHSADNSRR